MTSKTVIEAVPPDPACPCAGCAVLRDVKTAIGELEAALRSEVAKLDALLYVDHRAYRALARKYQERSGAIAATVAPFLGCLYGPVFIVREVPAT